MSESDKQTTLFSTVEMWYLKVKKLVDILSASFWFVPSLIITLAMSLAISLQYLDYNLPFVKVITNTFASINSETSLSLIQVIATSVITVTSIAFSMTLIALTMASNQFGPRLIRRFMENKRTQIVLGCFTGTFVYCLIVLSQINITDTFAVAPVVSVFIAKIMAILCVFLLIFFIHHVAVSIQADTVVSDVASALHRDLEHLQEQQQSNRASGEGFVNADLFTYNCKIITKNQGYVQAIEYQSLVAFAKEHDGMLDMHVRAGKFVFSGSPIATMRSQSTLPTTLYLDQFFIIADQRTPLQDPQFAINQLVEMALRALSPSINDPFTAINCINKLAGALATFTPDNVPRDIVLDEQQEMRVLTNEEPFEDLFACAFTQIRQNSYDHIAVSCHLLDVFIELLTADSAKLFLHKPIAIQVDAIRSTTITKDLSKMDKEALEERATRCESLIKFS